MTNETWTIQDSDRLYNVSKWSNGYFKIEENGQLKATPNPNKNVGIVINDVIEEAKEQGIQLPLVIRFHDILRSQVKLLNNTFQKVIDDEDYRGKFFGVYPVKVNQMREVVEEIVDAGSRYNYGLEAGSKPELLSALAYNNNADSLTVLNGYKDRDYLKLAILGAKLGRKIFVVIEKFSELRMLVELGKEHGVIPFIGIRGRMSVKGRGKWESSGGDKAKFGLTTSEIILAIEFLKKHDRLDMLKLFHFHIGSQITDIRSIKEAIEEGSRIYCKMQKIGAPLQYFDVGGGLGVDYDGTNSTNDSSINYSITDYITDIVYGLKSVCDLEGVEHPHIITESGRAITAHHSCVITNIIGEIDNTKIEFSTKQETGEHNLVTEMRQVGEVLEKTKNWQEAYNDALKIKTDSIHAFKLGILELEERAKIETMHLRILKEINSLVPEEDFQSELMQDLENTLSGQYLCNFSVFQSACDSWAIEQVLPVVPLTRLNEKPLKRSTLADITCDSDGKIDRFYDPDEGFKKTIAVHQLNEGEEYRIGIFLTGAYQDVMGDMHNLFGRVNEVHVYADSDDPKGFYIEETVEGNSARQVLSTMQYNPEFMAFKVKRYIDRQVSRGRIRPRDGVSLVDFYEDCLKSYTYLK
ncbi:arginine 2-monooxygenase [Bacteriovorax sp. BAL6_X]|uniref:biosynthetic arginine decarboxylase n=1 Tax=Bacteriovorax sp. BAL6_X TaxID=1201290 RepID=UPI00038585E2|nr:biosynthetic arginine decarboxylase [Bacteriovorax sp. BAL6_X]EPZ50793.1 arginine 2-monooxygenase [Bacteriovorax sp. BAL6_X]